MPSVECRLAGEGGSVDEEDEEWDLALVGEKRTSLSVT